MNNYKPLPYNLTVKDSSIHGLGLFAVYDIEAYTNLGMIHYYVDDFEIIRTPLGGFINHSDKPNCHRSQIRVKPGLDKWIITVVEDVNPGDELTLKYTMYDPRK